MARFAFLLFAIGKSESESVRVHFDLALSALFFFFAMVPSINDVCTEDCLNGVALKFGNMCELLDSLPNGVKNP